LSGAVVLRVESSALGAGKAMAVAPNGDVLLGTSNYPDLSTYRVLRVDPQGGISTLSNSDIGSGPALDLIEALGVLADGDLVALSHRKEPGVICPDETVLLRVDDSSGDRSVLAGVGVGTGPELSSLSAITVTPAGAILAKIDVEGMEPEVLAVLRRSGHYARISGMVVEAESR
jgi:hypothetical protein